MCKLNLSEINSLRGLRAKNNIIHFSGTIRIKQEVKRNQNHVFVLVRLDTKEEL